MTRKRLIKLMMGRGCDRNSAKALAEKWRKEDW